MTRYATEAARNAVFEPIDAPGDAGPGMEHAPRSAASTILIIPGLFDSAPDHWQSWLERRVAGSVRVRQDDWTDPDLPRWTARVAAEIRHARPPVFLVAHSFGCLAAVAAATAHAARVAGAMLVAPADPDRWNIGAALPQLPLGFPAIAVASANDGWMSIERTALWAHRWGAELINLGNAGHVTIESGFGPWPQGLDILDRLRRAAAAATLCPSANPERELKQELCHVPSPLGHDIR